MNVLLRDTEEHIDGKHTGSLGLVLIRYAFTLSWLLSSQEFRVWEKVLTTTYRCNNILWMGTASDVEMTDLGLK
jgi:small nuclear ribonucleoprotein F